MLVADIRSRIDQHDEKAERMSAVQVRNRECFEQGVMLMIWQALCEIAMDRVRRHSPAFPQATNTTSVPA